MDPQIQQLADELGIDYAAAEKISYLPRHEQEMVILEAQMGRANALRDTEAPQGRQAGRVYVAANPLEFIGRGIQQYRGGKEAQRVEEARQEALTKEEKARQAGALAEIRAQQRLIDDLRGPGAAAAPVQGPPAPAAAPAPTPQGSVQGGQVGGAGAPPVTPQPQARPIPQIDPTVEVLRGGGGGMPPGPRGAQAAPVQGPPEPGWFDQNPARQAMMARLNALRNFEGFGRRAKNAPPSQPSGPPQLGDRPYPPEGASYPWPRRW